MNEKGLKILLWIARVWAALMVVFMIFMLIAHLFGDEPGQVTGLTIRDWLMIPSMIISIIGLALGWKWERLGGWLAVGGMLAFYLFDFFFSGDFPRGITFLIIVFPGVLFLIHSYLQESHPAGQ